LLIYLLRHTQVRLHNTCYGRSPVPFDPASPSTLAQLRQQLPHWRTAPVLTSPAERCRALTEQVFERPGVICDALQEMHFGQWELCNWDTIARDQLDAWAAAPADFAPPGGENFVQVCQRVAQCVAEQLASPPGEGPPILVTHAGVVRAFLHLYEGVPLAQLLGQSIAFCSLTPVRLPATGPAGAP
jgi:alpha-ribazole phosphatase